MQSFFVKNLDVGPKSSFSVLKAAKFQILGRFIHTVFFISKDLSIVMPTPVELTNEQTQNKNNDNILLLNKCHKLKLITEPTPLLSLSYRRNWGVFIDMCFYIGLLDNSDIFFYFQGQFYFQRSQTLTNSVIDFFFSTPNFCTTFYLDSILFSPFQILKNFCTLWYLF